MRVSELRPDKRWAINGTNAKINANANSACNKKFPRSWCKFWPPYVSQHSNRKKLLQSVFRYFTICYIDAAAMSNKNEIVAKDYFLLKRIKYAK